MEVTLYKYFDKRKNSILKPEWKNIEGVTKDLKIKSNFGFENQNQSTKCSIYTPSFFLRDAVQYTYLKAWDYYYFITDISYDIDGAEYITCEMDVLASFAGSIQATSSYVEYSSNNFSLLLEDERVIPKQGIWTDTNRATLPGLTSTASTVLLTVIDGNRGTQSYVCSIATTVGIIYTLSSADLTVLERLRMQFQGAWNGIVGCRIVPFSNIQNTGSQEEIYIADFPTGAFGYPVRPTDPGAISSTCVLEPPIYYNDFRRTSERFTRIEVYLPFVGVIEINPNDLMETNVINVTFIGNATTGSGIYSLRDADGRIITTCPCTFGAEIPIGTLSTADAIGSVGTIGSAFSGAAHSAIMMGISGPAGVLSSIGTGLQAGANFSKDISTTSHLVGGYSGNYAHKISTNCSVTTICALSHNEPSDFTELYGNPCAQVLQLSQCIGYVKTSGFSVTGSMLSEIRNRINALMDSGVYMEFS